MSTFDYKPNIKKQAAPAYEERENQLVKEILNEIDNENKGQPQESWLFNSLEQQQQMMQQQMMEQQMMEQQMMEQQQMQRKYFYLKNKNFEDLQNQWLTILLILC